LNGDRLKLAVFIDFDNIEIGVKSTLNRHFDVGTVLEAIKERGEVVTKVAYGDWKRAGEHSRSMTQHAIQMVQRNLTPGGDKNGADINLALDALEMAFTRNHINAFVIVGGDSDFMALVEKLKQYDKKVLVVGGRSFTSTILQKNCHEFIAYENLIAPQGGSRRPAERTRVAGTVDANLAKALPLVRRALKVLSDREVSPQLGLLKSTLLQLDSTFSERDYGANTFRDFIEKMAAAGYVNLKQVDRSLLVEVKDGENAVADEGERPPAPAPAPAQSVVVSVSPAESTVTTSPTLSPTGPAQAQVDEAMRALREIFAQAKVTPHWPMYLRNVKQYVKNAAPTFDERRFGFASFLEVIRAGQRTGLFRLERNRQGILRIFAGSQFPSQVSSPPSPIEEEVLAVVEAAPPLEERVEAEREEQMQLSEQEPIIEAAPAMESMQNPSDQEQDTQPVGSDENRPARARRPRTTAVSVKKKPAVPRPRSTPARRPTKKKTQDTEGEL
jgi:uncharacterized protein (TIGR00288 family)